MKGQKWIKLSAVRKVVSAARKILRKKLVDPQTPPRGAIAVLLVLFSGIRLRELQLLTWGDGLLLADKTNPRLNVRWAKRGKRRLILVPREFVSAWNQYKQWSTRAGLSTTLDAPLLPSPRPRTQPISRRTLQLAVKAFLADNGAEGFTIHSLRHTYATHFYLASHRDLDTLRKQLGHSDITTTALYVGTLSQAIQQALNDLYDHGLA